MNHNSILFRTTFGAMVVIGSVSFLLLLYIVSGSQLASQGDTGASANTATAFINAYAQSSDFNLNGTSENDTSGGNNNHESIPTTTGTFNYDSSSTGANTDQLENTPAFMEIRGHIGGMIAEDSTGGATIGDAENETAQSIRGGKEYVMTGHWRVVANQSILERFVANLTIARTDGMESHIIIIEDEGPRFDLSSTGNIITSEFPATIYRNNFNLTTISAPVQLSLRGNNIMQFSATINNDNSTSLPASLQILRLLDERPVFGTVDIVTTES